MDIIFLSYSVSPVVGVTYTRWLFSKVRATIKALPFFFLNHVYLISLTKMFELVCYLQVFCTYGLLQTFFPRTVVMSFCIVQERKWPPHMPKRPARGRGGIMRERSLDLQDRQRQEARRRLMAAKRAASFRQNSATERADSIEIYIPEAQTRLWGPQVPPPLLWPSSSNLQPLHPASSLLPLHHPADVLWVVSELHKAKV